MNSHGFPRQLARHGFSLVEILVTIGIIGLLIALLIPAVQAARESSRQKQCANNIKQIGLGLQLYHEANRKFPMGAHYHETRVTVGPNAGKYHFHDWAWPMRILPHIEQQNLWTKMDKTVGPDPFKFGPIAYLGNFDNQVLSQTVIPTFVCPSDPLPHQMYAGAGGGPRPLWFGKTNYVGVADSQDLYRGIPNGGPGGEYTYVGNGMLFNTVQVGLASVTDGTSNTLFVGEGTGFLPNAHQPLHFTWCSYALADMGKGINGEGSVTKPGHTFEWSHSGFSSYHDGGCFFLLVDGSVRFMNEATSQAILEALATRNGKETIPAGSY